MYVCLCHAITERHIEQAVDRGASRLKDLRASLRVATECGRCASCARDCLRQSLATRNLAEAQQSGEQMQHREELSRQRISALA